MPDNLDKKSNGFFAFLSKTNVKTTLMGIIPIIIAIDTSILFYYLGKNKNGTVTASVVALVVLIIVYVMLLCYYAKHEKTIRKLNKELKNQTSALVKTAESICTICKSSAESFNTFSHSVVEESKIDMNIWSFDRMAMNICDSIYGILRELSGYEDLDVTYTQLINDQNCNVKTIGYSNKDSIKPHIYKKIRCYNDATAYFDAQIFREDNPEIIVFDNPGEIADHFYIKNRETYDNKYSQYIAVPIICNDDKIVGVIQIVSKYTDQIATDKEELKKIARKYISQFALLALLLSKSEKEMLAVPGIKVKKRSVD